MGSQAPAAPIRLAILEADTPLPQTKAKYSSYGGVFTSLFARAAAPRPLSDVLDISCYAAVSANPSYPSLDAIDAILITGSRHSAFEDGEGGWIAKLTEYVRRALESDRRVKVVGVCFGHQIVARALGVPVGRNEGGWEVSVTEMRLTEKGRELFGRETLVSAVPSTCWDEETDCLLTWSQKIHQMHRDAVGSLPAGAESLAQTDTCPMQGFLIPGKVITVQGHPEFTEAIVKEILDSRHAVGILSDEIYKSGVDRVADEHDGVAVARAFLKFLSE